MQQTPFPTSQSSAKPYDVIIIGAGLSGLVAAAYLSKAGASVLVCEQGAQIGGLFNSFQRQGFHFDGGIKAIENSAVMMPMLAQLGLLDQVQLEPNPVAMIIGGATQPIASWQDVSAYFGLLAGLFPGEEKGLHRIQRDTRRIFEILDGMLTFPPPNFDLPGEAGKEARAAWSREHGKKMLRFPQIVRFFNQELLPYLRNHLHDAHLINLVSDLFPQGTSVFFGLGYFRLFLDYYYPREGIAAIPQVLAAAIRGWGGEIRLNARVEQVLLKEGKACGVRLDNGEEILAGQIVAASNLKQALTRLTSESNLPASFAEKLKSAEVSQSVFNVFLGLDVPPEALELPPYHHFFYHPDLRGINAADRLSLPDYFAHVPQEISIPCLANPALAPAGKTGINLSAMTVWEYNGGWEQDPAEYARLKQEYAWQMIRSVENIIPGLSDHIELMFAATPRTIAAMTSNQHGAIMGWSYDRKRTMPRGNFLQMGASIYTPIPGLLTAGHWAYSPGGSPVAVMTGKLAAEAILNQDS